MTVAPRAWMASKVALGSGKRTGSKACVPHSPSGQYCQSWTITSRGKRRARNSLTVPSSSSAVLYRSRLCQYPSAPRGGGGKEVGVDPRRGAGPERGGGALTPRREPEKLERALRVLSAPFDP